MEIEQSEMQEYYERFASVGRSIISIAEQNDEFVSNPVLFTMDVVTQRASHFIRERAGENLKVQDVRNAVFGTIEVALRQSLAVLETRTRGETTNLNDDLLLSMIDSVTQVQRMMNRLNERFPDTIKNAISVARKRHREWNPRIRSDLEWAEKALEGARQELVNVLGDINPN